MAKAEKKIVRFPSTEYNPELLLNQLLEVVPDIKNLYIVVQWKEDDSMDPYFTKMKTSQICMASMLTQAVALQKLDGD